MNMLYIRILKLSFVESFEFLVCFFTSFCEGVFYINPNLT